MAPSMFGFQEHRRLFGFSANSSKQKRDGSSCGWRAKKTKQRPTWTRTFVCLAHTDVERMPSVNDNIELKEASLGEKRLTNFLLTMTATILTKKLRSAYPKLFGAGGYILLRGGHSRIFQKLDPPYHVSRLKERVGQGKIFIRPLQRDLELTWEGCLDEYEVTEFQFF